uniref:Uncharacterized protein n=1 Tax=Arundo donax TaxID=35708 RepID=A0A0A8ZU40_ARUDO
MSLMRVIYFVGILCFSKATKRSIEQ